MIVRLSGPRAYEIVGMLCDAAFGGGRGAARTVVRAGEVESPGWVYWFSSPRSYSGEDLVELHVPGNVLLVRMLLGEAMSRGARAAEAGEFTARAYLNGRMDLAEAEGVAATIAAHGAAELAAARRLMSGELSRRVGGLMDRLTEALALVEAGIDFSDEAITLIPAEEVKRRAGEIEGELVGLEAESARFERLSHEPQVVLAGRPNAGKSTLLNALAGVERAVVSAEAGTTRDVIWAEAALERGMVRLVDAAGLAEEEPRGDSAGAQIARQMHQRAMAAVEGGDVIVLVKDVTDERPMLRLRRQADLVVLSKADLVEGEASAHGRDARATFDGVAVSAKTGRGMEAFRRRLGELAFGRLGEGGTLALNERHLQAIAEARSAMERAGAAAGVAGDEVVALELREGLDALGRIVGRVTADDVLGRVFERFCIGK